MLNDDAGHQTTGNFTVNVVEPSSDESTEQAQGTEDFATFAEKYGGDGKSLGIDVSRWQGYIDFQKVKNAGCEFAIIRLGGFDDGELYTDRYYLQNIKNAKAAGLKVGIYWHAEESNVEEVKNSAAYLLKVLDGESLDFPVAYDWEDFACFQNHNMNLHDINNCFNEFSKQMQDAGYSSCLYSSKNFLENCWTNKLGLDVWLAHYTSNTNYTGAYYMWQHSSSGKIDGISGAVDLNIYYKKE
jgi:GH25 family lysozyme M1 (1,4-beta-N-acetylmuramidase)